MTRNWHNCIFFLLERPETGSITHPRRNKCFETVFSLFNPSRNVGKHSEDEFDKTRATQVEACYLWWWLGDVVPGFWRPTKCWQVWDYSVAFADSRIFKFVNDNKKSISDFGNRKQIVKVLNKYPGRFKRENYYPDEPHYLLLW